MIIRLIFFSLFYQIPRKEITTTDNQLEKTKHLFNNHYKNKNGFKIKREKSIYKWLNTRPWFCNRTAVIIIRATVTINGRQKSKTEQAKEKLQFYNNLIRTFYYTDSFIQTK